MSWWGHSLPFLAGRTQNAASQQEHMLNLSDCHVYGRLRTDQRMQHNACVCVCVCVCVCFHVHPASQTGDCQIHFRHNMVFIYGYGYEHLQGTLSRTLGRHKPPCLCLRSENCANRRARFVSRARPTARSNARLLSISHAPAK